jgi:ribonuclease Z
LPFEVKILGSSSATPTTERNQSSQLLNIHEQFYLLDCGEGTQLQLLKAKAKINKIRHIYISHLHGDHYLGLFGLISSMHLGGRNAPLTIFGPRGLAEIITLQLRYSETILTYPVNFYELDETPSVIFEDDKITVTVIAMNHRIKCYGFIFKEKEKKRKLIKEKIPAEMRLQDIVKLKNGEDLYSDSGELVIKNAEVTYPPRHCRSYAYCADTLYDERILQFISDVDLLYHESTFSSELQDRAIKTHHSTAREAGIIARKANAGMLIIGHFSTRYRDLRPLLAEARNEFPNTMLAFEGELFSIEEKFLTNVPSGGN